MKNNWITTALLTGALCLTGAFGACAAEAETAADIEAGTEAEISDAAIRVSAMKGPTAMGMVRLMADTDAGESDLDCSFTLVGAVDEVPPMLVKGEIDLAAIPANLASVLYNNTDGGVEVLAVNTLGVLYIVENGENVSSVADLAGRTLYASGKGATPEYALNYILRENGLDPETDLTIEWKSEHAECLAALLADEDGIAMLPQPFVTTAQMKNESIRVALDLTAEWDALQEGSESPSGLITGVLVARTAFAEEHPDEVNAFLDAYADSVAWVNENTEEAAALIGSYDIVPEQVAVKALPACNIVCITGEEMQEKLSGYLAVLADQDASSVGGAVPADDFYYIAEAE